MPTSNSQIAKIKLRLPGDTTDTIFNIKDLYARESKLDNTNSSGTGYISYNGIGNKGVNSVSLGYHNTASGNAAAAIGSLNEVTSDFGVGIGRGLKVNFEGLQSLGKFNLPLSEDAFEVGQGTDSNHRENILRLTKTGNLYIKKDIYFGASDEGIPKSLNDTLSDLQTQITHNEYELPKATKLSLGGVIIGENINIDKNGVISVQFPEYSQYKLPIASSSKLGGVAIGEHLSIDENGVLSVVYPEIPDPYILPAATSDELGGIKVKQSEGFKIEDGVLKYYTEKMNKSNPDGLGTFKMNTSATVGIYSVSLGSNSAATGAYGIALGQSNTTSGVNGVAIGSENSVRGDAAAAIGRSNIVNGANSFAIGLENKISKTNAYTFGEGLIANSKNQIVIGQYNDNQNTNIFELGLGSSDESRKNGVCITENGDTYVLGNLYIDYDSETDEYFDVRGRIVALEEIPPYSLPIASDTVLGGIKVGRNLTINEDGVLDSTVDFDSNDFSCTGYFSHNRVENTHIGENSFASNSTALSSNSTAFGYHTVAGKTIVETIEVEDPKTGEITEEEITTYAGSYAFSEGIESKAEGFASHAAGENTKAGYDYQFILGRYNQNKETNIFEIGYGNSDDDRINLLELTKTGILNISNALNVNGININAGVQTLTNSAYEALPAADKNKDIIYLITDTDELYYKGNKYGSGSGESIVVDDILSLVSENPVQNKIITTELNKKLALEILTNENLNTIFTDGYKIYHADNSSQITNKPDEVAGNFDLVSAGNGTAYYQHLYNKSNIYVRETTEDIGTDIDVHYAYRHKITQQFFPPEFNVYIKIKNDSNEYDKGIWRQNLTSDVRAFALIYEDNKVEIYKANQGRDAVIDYVNGVYDSWGNNGNNVTYTTASYTLGSPVWSYNNVEGLYSDSMPFYLVSQTEDILNYLNTGDTSQSLNLRESTLSWTDWVEISNNDNVYTKTETDNLLNNKQDTLIAGDNITIQNNVISSSGAGVFIGNVPTNYSTEEKVIGTWIDGKPLYQKTYYLSSPLTISKDTWVQIQGISIADIDRAISTICANERGQFDCVISDLKSSPIELWNTRSADISIDSITCQYTKTTDTAYTVPIGYSDYYSTDEQIVGRWIDGKPLYQKTLSFTNLTGAINDVPTGITNVEKVCYMEGICLQNNTNGSYRALPYAIPSTYTDSIGFVFNKNDATIEFRLGGNTYSELYITIRYTKTTD